MPGPRAPRSAQGGCCNRLLDGSSGDEIAASRHHSCGYCARIAIVEYWSRQDRRPWRKTDVILPRHDLRERDLKGDKGTPITAYVARPSGPGPFPGVVLVHHLPGWSEFYIETTRRFAHHGYIAICANLYERAGQGNPDDVAAKVRAEGGIPDAQMVGDTEAAVKWMRAQPGHNGKVGLFGSCSGGRHAFIYACQKKDVDACVELWGGRVVMGKEELNAKTPVAPIDMTKDLSLPAARHLRQRRPRAEPRAGQPARGRAQEARQEHEFHRYDGAGHGIFYCHRPLYRPEQAMDGWSKVFAFFGKHLAK